MLCNIVNHAQLIYYTAVNAVHHLWKRLKKGCRQNGKFLYFKKMLPVIGRIICGAMANVDVRQESVEQGFISEQELWSLVHSSRALR